MKALAAPNPTTLPLPWRDASFVTSHIGFINFLVGPNGSGKTRFAEQWKSRFQNSRFLGAERLHGMERARGLGMWGDPLQNGFSKNQFSQFRSAGPSFNSGIDTFVLLEERFDLRLQVEATLSHLFNRRIVLEWDSGHLVAKAILGDSGESYRLDKEECHGIKELLVLLTHLYHDEYKYLFIDEPELNLHPQFQAFFMEEVRKVAGDPDIDPKKKIIFLITHSPFILDFRSAADLKSVISFDATHSVPKHIYDLDAETTDQITPLVPRLNVHHKQLFFSDNPIFVEGIFDAQMLQMIQERRGVSIAAAGSCIIEAGGNEEVSKYLRLCRLFGKKAFFLYDLDSLFRGNLRSCIRDDSTIASFLAELGLGSDFAGYCGALDQKLTSLIGRIRTENPSTEIQPLRNYLDGLVQGNGPWTNAHWGKARAAFIIHLRKNRQSVVSTTSEQDITDVEGRLNQIIGLLEARNVILLPDGALEHYLPSYTGDIYELNDQGKSQAVIKEISFLSSNSVDISVLQQRYGNLYEAIKKLPSKPPVSFDKTLKQYLGGYIFELQNSVMQHPDWGLADISRFMTHKMPGIEKLLILEEFTKQTGNEFIAKIKIIDRFGTSNRSVNISHRTNAGMGDFEINPV